MAFRIFKFLFFLTIMLITIPSLIVGYYCNLPVKTSIEGISNINFDFLRDYCTSFKDYIFLNETDLSRKIITNEPLLKYVTIKRVFPHELQIKGLPREILAIIKYGSSKYLLDKDGEVVEYDREEDHDYKVIQVKSSYSININNLRKLCSYLHKLEINNKNSLIQISSIEINETDNMTIEFNNGVIAKVPQEKFLKLSNEIFTLFQLHNHNTVLDFRFEGIVIVQDGGLKN